MKKIFLFINLTFLCLNVNSQTWSAFGNAIGNYPYGAVFCYRNDSVNNVLYAGGSFNTISGSYNNFINKWNGTSWGGLSSLSDFVGGMEIYSGKLHVIAKTSVVRRDGNSWTTIGSTPGNTQAYACAIYAGQFYIGGNFTTIGGNSFNYIAKWNGTTWSSVGTGMNNRVSTLKVVDGELYAGGEFTTAGGVTVNRVAKWNGTIWTALGTGITSTSSAVYSLAKYGTDIYAGGHFTVSNGTGGNYIAKWDGISWTPVGTGMDNNVSSLVVFAGELYVGGYFTTAGGIAASKIAKWNGTSWSAIGVGADNTVQCMEPYNGQLYVGGSFTSAGGISANHMAILTPASSSAKDITAFSFNGLSPAVIGTINNTNITLTVPFGTNLTNLVATFTCSLGASVKVGSLTQISGTSANNFTTPVNYIVMAPDASTQTYVVTVVVSPNAYWNWYPQSSGVSNNLHSVYFVDDNNGWAVGSFGSILHTINGGTNWVPQSSGVTSTLYSVKFTSQTDGWIVGKDETILHTTNAGLTWSASLGTAGSNYFSVCFISTSVGWIGGDWGKVLHTTDGGVNWNIQSTGFYTQIASIYFKDANHGWAVGDDASNVAIKTNDGGSSWYLSNVGITCPLECVFFIDDTTGWVAGKFNWASGDGGNYFSGMSANAGTGNHMYGIQFIDHNTGYCVGDTGLITYSINGGSSWSQLSSGTMNRLNAIHINSSNIAWSVGANGTILKNQPSIMTKIENIFNANFIVYPNPSNGIFAITTNENDYLLTITNILGENVYASEIKNQKVEIDLGKQPKGIYLLKTCNAKGIHTEKIIVQ